MAVATLRSSVVFILCLPGLLSPSLAAAQSRPASQPATLSVEDEVLANILNQRIGDRTVADDGLPEEYLRRVADRVIRASYQQVFRAVVDDRGAGTSQPGSPPRAGVSTRPAAPGLSVYAHTLSPRELSAWQALPESRPPLRGFRAPIIPGGIEQPFGPLPADAPTELRGLAAIVSRGLSKNGLLRTTADAMLSFGASSFVDDTQNSCDVLAAAGLPVDLLGYFGGERGGEKAWLSVARKLATGLESGKSIDDVVATVAKDFRPHPIGGGFRAFVDSGEGSFETLRLQLTRGDYWVGEGDGGSVDIARQLVARLPDVKFLISIESDYVGTLFETARGWRGNGFDRMRLVTEPMTVSQWAQDDARAGELTSRDGKGRLRAILAPRYASRGEDGSILVPGDSLLLAGLRAAGEAVFQSPLLFQGGNLIVYRDPRDGRRTLLISEADILRNRGLGLSRSEAIEAFRVEFGVDRCEVLPAISYHIDYEVSVRAQAGGLFAFVNDTPAASRIIIDCGLEALVRKGLIPAEDARRARAALGAGRTQEVLELAAGAVFARANADGQFPIGIADAFSAGPTDSGVGNLRRFLVACDELAAQAVDLDEQSIDRNSRAYLGSLRRREAEREHLREQLTGLGFRVVAVPSLSDAEQSINYINGLHDASRFLMPAYGGIFAKLDEAAAAAFSLALGPAVQVLPIYCSESQRRDGAVRCSVSVYTDSHRAKSSGDR